MDVETEIELPKSQLENGLSKNTTEFKSIVDKSRQNVSKVFIKPPTEKGKPGRKPLPRDEKGNIIRPEKAGATAAPSMGDPSVVQQPPPDLSEHLITPLSAISKIPAARAGMPELALTQDEARDCAIALNQVIQAFVPDVQKMDPRTAAVLTAGATIGSIAYTKYALYIAKKSEIKKENTNQTDSEIITAGPANPTLGTISAESHFRKDYAGL